MSKRSCIVDYLGRPTSTNGYISSGSSRRSMRGWNPSANSADSDIIPHINELRASSRDLSMNSPVASGILNRFKDSVIGHGLYLQSRIDRDLLKLTPDDAEAWERNTEREFRLLADTKEIDAERTSNFYQLQILLYYSKNLSGDVFFFPVSIPRSRVPYDLRIKTLEADMVSNPNLRFDDETIAGGIEVDGDGAPIAYHISQKHPGGLLVFNNKWERIPAYSTRTNLRQVHHIFSKLRPGQRRGFPLFAPVVESLKQITRLTESELMAAVVTSFYTAFITTESGDDLDIDFDENEKIISPDSSSKQMGPGSNVLLDKGQSVTLADPKRPNGAFAPFFETLVKEISSSTGIPYEVAMLNFTSSYSAARAALLMAYKVFMNDRVDCGREICQPIYERFLLEAVLKGTIIAPGFLESLAIRQAWSKAAWIGQGQGQINPVVETKAALMRVEGKLSTRSKEVALYDGDDWDTMIDSLAREDFMIAKKWEPVAADTTDVNSPEFKTE